jgi:hypothetical protein
MGAQGLASPPTDVTDMPWTPTDRRRRLIIGLVGRLAGLVGNLELAVASFWSRRWTSSLNRSFAPNPDANRSSDSHFSEDELRRLYWLRATVIAERHRLGTNQQVCSDHQACRRLAFALWLRCRRSLK